MDTLETESDDKSGCAHQMDLLGCLRPFAQCLEQSVKDLEKRVSSVEQFDVRGQKRGDNGKNRLERSGRWEELDIQSDSMQSSSEKEKSLALSSPPHSTISPKTTSSAGSTSQSAEKYKEMIDDCSPVLRQMDLDIRTIAEQSKVLTEGMARLQNICEHSSTELASIHKKHASTRNATKRVHETLASWTVRVHDLIERVGKLEGGSAQTISPNASIEMDLSLSSAEATDTSIDADVSMSGTNGNWESVEPRLAKLEDIIVGRRNVAAEGKRSNVADRTEGKEEAVSSHSSRIDAVEITTKQIHAEQARLWKAVEAEAAARERMEEKLIGLVEERLSKVKSESNNVPKAVQALLGPVLARHRASTPKRPILEPVVNNNKHFSTPRTAKSAVRTGPSLRSTPIPEFTLKGNKLPSPPKLAPIESQSPSESHGVETIDDDSPSNVPARDSVGIRRLRILSKQQQHGNWLQSTMDASNSKCDKADEKENFAQQGAGVRRDSSKVDAINPRRRLFRERRPQEANAKRASKLVPRPPTGLSNKGLR